MEINVLSDMDTPFSASSQFCSHCKELTTYDGLLKLSQGGVFKHLTVGELLENSSSAKPCPVCLIIKQSILELSEKPSNAQVRFNMKKLRDGLVMNLSEGVVVVVGRPDDYTGYDLVLDFLANKDDPAAVMTDRQPVLYDVASEEAFELTRSWLRTCEEDHLECPKFDFVPELPTYVVDVCPESPGVGVRLHESVTGERAKYLCLSYCWGIKQQLTTVRANLEDFKESIPPTQLGKTLQDAIETTLRLGFRYVWIDALCIVQDDNEGKIAEIMNMSTIYKNATATIMASVTTAASDGFLRTDRATQLKDMLKDPKNGYEGNVKPCFFHVTLPNGAVGQLILAPGKDFRPNHLLDQRAWALQEYLLSNRKLIFSTVELLVECRKHKPRPLRDSFIHYDAIFLDVYYMPPISNWDWTDSHWPKWWSELIQGYSTRALTNKEDRVHAFQGINTEIGALSGKTTRYGVPGFHSTTLAWYACQPASARSTRAPSWSWACLDTMVRGLSCYPDDKPHAHVRFDDNNDPRRLAVTACVIMGATWSGKHPIEELSDSKSGRTCFKDLRTGLPAPQDSLYLLVSSRSDKLDTVLILESAGPDVYRRTGVYKGDVFLRRWPKDRQEIVLI